MEIVIKAENISVKIEVHEEIYTSELVSTLLRLPAIIGHSQENVDETIIELAEKLPKPIPDGPT